MQPDHVLALIWLQDTRSGHLNKTMVKNRQTMQIQSTRILSSRVINLQSLTSRPRREHPLSLATLQNRIRVKVVPENRQSSGRMIQYDIENSRGTILLGMCHHSYRARAHRTMLQNTQQESGPFQSCGINSLCTRPAKTVGTCLFAQYRLGILILA